MINYNNGKDEYKNWIVSETQFKVKYQKKCEAIFCLGNGHLGIRSATEESYLGQVRNTFISGTFNKFGENEVTELPNAADMIAIDIYIDGELFSLEKGIASDYERTLNLKTGELKRHFTWTNKQGKTFNFLFKRFVSFHDLHLFATKVEITSVDCDADIEIYSGINGQVTNSGSQHFLEGEKRIFDNRYIQMLQKTTESNITFVHNTVHNLSVDEKNDEFTYRFDMDRRKVGIYYEGSVLSNQTLLIEKISNIYTTRDKDMEEKSLKEIKDISLKNIKDCSRAGYDVLRNAGSEEWKKIWDTIDIKIDSNDDYNQLAVRFAQYHILSMTPMHDNRCGIGAKGLSGEGYKGHSFWDTEIFILPFFTFTMPEVAKSLLEYRYNMLEGAHAKAKENGYRGAMYPWESAWIKDGEVTPVWGGADIVTGKPTKIWSGFIEQHVTSDIAFAVWQYYQITGDEEFINKYGYEILFDTAIFWASRLEWNKDKNEYHINNVVGPDEFQEHVNNDAFTNYMAHWCMEKAVNYYRILKKNNPQTFAGLNKKLNLDKEIDIIEDKINKIYLQLPNKDGLIPQDDTYLSKKNIDLTKYKNQKNVGSISKDYNPKQRNKIQVSKQASVVMLVYLLEYKFNNKIKQSNFDYYEPRTLHDSSLSLAIHSILASDVDKPDLAYKMFRKATEIDLSKNMKTSDSGIHAASFGGIWQAVICGFCGVRMVQGKLRINPKLPKQINSITFPLLWKGNKLEIKVTNKEIKIKNKGKESVEFSVYNKKYFIEESTLKAEIINF